MTDLSPFHYPIPKKFLSDPELRPWVTYLHKHLQQTWVKLGGSEDAIETTVTRDAYDSTMYAAGLEEALRRIECLEKRNLYQPVNEEALKKIAELEVKSLQEPSFPVKLLSRKVISNEIYESSGNEFIKGKKGSVVKLPQNPQSDCVVYVNNGDGELLEIDGNGKKINGHDKAYIRRKGNGLQIYYFIEDNEYIAI